MTKLVTKHDPFHVHKLLGGAVLLHFAARITLLVCTGNAFPPSEPKKVATMCIMLHAVLSWSSLVFSVPRSRHAGAPMIWPEFRWHSIIFASRHALCSIVSLHDKWPDGVLSVPARLAPVLIASTLAGYVTRTMGDRNRRTTNAMPYPDGMDARLHKLEYARAQFAATHAATLSDTTLNWLPLFAIQLSPLLMTLVRKGKIDARVYHNAYAAALWIGYPLSAIRIAFSPHPWYLVSTAGCAALTARARLRWGTRHAVVWTAYVIVTFMLWSPMHRFSRFGWIAALAIVPAMIRQARIYSSV